MIVTIDGPAGAGKSSCAQNLARRLDFRFLDTGAMYRAVALAVIEAGIDKSNRKQIEEVARQLDLRMDGDRVLVDGVDVSERIRSPAVTAATHYVADLAGVREHLVALQRRIANGHDVVTEGRDQGTVVFPQAECKIFLTASPRERAQRRARELQAAGAEVDWQKVLAEQNERDRRDAQRPVGRLTQAEDAIEVVTEGLSQEEVVDRLVNLVQEKRAGPIGPSAS